MTVLHHAGQRELLSYLSKRGIELGPDLVFLGTAKVKALNECAYCHIASAKKDKVWTQFYPLLDK